LIHKIKREFKSIKKYRNSSQISHIVEHHCEKGIYIWTKLKIISNIIYASQYRISPDEGDKFFLNAFDHDRGYSGNSNGVVIDSIFGDSFKIRIRERMKISQ
jgi:hypothetical protein